MGKTEIVATTVEVMTDYFLARHDPVLKAQRAAERKQRRRNAKNNEATKSELGISQATSREAARAPGRRPFTVDQEHTVQLKARGQCTYVDKQGRRCPNDRYLEKHHIIEVHRGGGNEPDNIQVLCWFHHDLKHQLSLPLDEQVDWLKSPVEVYGWNHSSAAVF
jgi:hypothetical protein